MARRTLLIVVIFVCSRAAIGLVAHDPDVYPPGSIDPTTDVDNYGYWAQQLQDGDQWPYRDFFVEYPPGALVVASVPYAVAKPAFRAGFIAESIVFDALGLWAMYRIASRRDHWRGVWAWLVLMPLLGPVAYTRLDMAVAACLAWAFERAETRRWTGAGGFLGLGAAVKLVPALLLPALALAAPRRWRPLAAAAACGVPFLLPFAGDLPSVVDDVLHRNAERGVHAESLWGSLALAARVAVDAPVDVRWAFGAADLSGSFTDELGLVVDLAAVIVLIGSVVLMARRVRPGDGAHAVLLAGAALIMLTAVGRVFSPQYLMWLVPAVGAGAAICPRQFRWPTTFLAIAVTLAHLVYPGLYEDYLKAEVWAVLIGLTRNVAILCAGVLAFRAALRYESPPPEAPAEPAAPSPQDVETRQVVAAARASAPGNG